MENNGPLNNNNDIDPSLIIGNNDTTDLQWYNPEHDMDTLLGADVNTGANNDAEKDKDNRKEGETSSKRTRRHTAEQLEALEGLFQACAHPDEETRNTLGAKIGLQPWQVKFWFQNRCSHKKMKARWEENNAIRHKNADLFADNMNLKQQILARSCSACVGLMAVIEPSPEKQRLILENARLKDEYLHAKAFLHEVSNGAALPLSVPSVHHSDADIATLLCQHAECAMKEFKILATTGEPLWLPTINGEVFNNQEYGSNGFPRLLGLCPEGFVVEATREAYMVRGTLADIVGIFTDVDRWSEIFSGMVATVAAQDMGSGGILPCDGQIQLMNAELWVPSPRVPNRSLKFLRFTKMMENGQKCAVVDVSVDSILGDGQEGSIVPPARHMGCRLLPSGCLIEDIGTGYSKVTWMVHVEYDETAVPLLFRPFFCSGQALGACRWLASLERQCEYMATLRSLPTADGRRGTVELAKRMTASFHMAISGPVILVPSNVSEWHGSCGTGAERFELAVRMVSWCTGNLPTGGLLAGTVLSAATTVWLPSTPPQRVFTYLCDVQRRGEWDRLANGAAMQELGCVATNYLHGNVVSVLRPTVTDGTNNMLVLQEVSTDASCSLLVYSLIEQNTIYSIMSGGDNSVFLLPSGFAILPDGHTMAHKPPAMTASSSSAPAGYNGATGSLLTMACQRLLPATPSDNLSAGAFFDDAGGQLCHVIEKIKAAVEADIIVPE